MKDWYLVNNIEAFDTPALMVYEQRVRQNIATAVKMTGEVSRLRPHVKTHKCAAVARLQLEAGITKFKCATIAEAEMLARVEAPDVLLAYQPNGPKLQRLLALVKAYPKTIFSCLIDNVHTAANLATAAIENQTSIDVFIDVNPGMNRTGIVAGEPAKKLYEDTAIMKGLHVRGFHVYDGHFTFPDYEHRKAACDAAFATVENMQQELKLKGYPAPTIIAGGSPTFPIHAQRKGIECSPGTFVFWDRGYQLSCPEQEFDLAALVATRVISLPTPTLLCLDLGHKSVAAENELTKRVYFLNAPEGVVTGHSEEHLLIELPVGHGFAVGNVLYGVAHHICPTVALYDSALVANDFTITAEWSIEARKRRITI